MDYILASASPRRKELLSKFISDFKIIPAGTDETFDPQKPVLEEIINIAKKKAAFVYEKHRDAVVIAADTIVLQDNTVYGKPKDRVDAIHMLKKLRNSSHQVVTAVSVSSPAASFEFAESTEVVFADYPDSIIEWYVNTNEPMDCAGAYAIQGFGSILVKRINGDYSNIVGLPVFRLIHTLLEKDLLTLKGFPI